MNGSSTLGGRKPTGSDAFNRAIAGQRFDLITSGNMTIAIRSAVGRVDSVGRAPNAQSEQCS